MERTKKIIRTSIIGVVANIFLAGFKAVVGLFAHSVAIVMDAVNNLTDALSSVITIIGARLAGKKPDKKHPYGHGRIEYLSATIISFIVLFAGATSLVESIKKMITPVDPDYSTWGLIIVGVAVAVKVALGVFVGRQGKKLDSDSLINSGKDALWDSVISASTLLAAGVFLIWGVSLEAYLGAVISILIIKSGIEMLIPPTSKFLGERISPELSATIKKIIISFDEVYGAYDLILHNYGPNKLMGSVHVEVADNMTADKIDKLERDIAQEVYQQTGVALVGIGIYARNTNGGKADEVFEEVRRIVFTHDYIVQMHGFYWNETEKVMRFDIVIDYSAPGRQEEYEHILNEIKENFPDTNVRITLDGDISD